MPAGPHDILVTIEERSQSRDAMGNAVDAWVARGTRWASVNDANGRELYRAQQIDANVTAVVTLREQFPGLSPVNRIAFTDHNGNARVMNVAGIIGESDRTAKRGQVVSVTEAA